MQSYAALYKKGGMNMWEKIKKGMDDAYQGIKTATSKITLKAEEKTKLTRMNLRSNTLKKEMDGVMAKMGNRLYTLRTQDSQSNVFHDGTIQDLFKEADRIQEDVNKLQQDMDRIREEYEGRIHGLGISSESEPAVKDETKEPAKAGKNN